MAPKICVIIPTKNEEKSIRGIVEKTKEALEGVDYEIIVADASTDNTPTEAIKAGARLVKQIGNGGVGEALIQAFYWTKGHFVVFFDGDGTYDPGDIHKLMEPLFNNEADLVNGNRFFDMEKGAMPFGNKLGNIFLTQLGNVLFHTSIKDSQSGMKAFRREMLMRVTLWERGFPFCSEIIAEASKLGMRVTEVGISYRKRLGTQTKLNPASAGFKIFLASLKMMRDYDPFFLFLEIGLVLEAIGFIIAWPAIVEYLEYGIFRLLGRAILAMFCWFAGLLSIFTGIILEGFNYALKKVEARLGQQSR
ncbi:MAG: glycosyltransferase [Candidatus Bathyarchaeia archaeon]